jgi:hypothetical protein
MPPEMIGEHAGHHGFADRNRADADARVVAAFGRDVGVELRCSTGTVIRVAALVLHERKAANDQSDALDLIANSCLLGRFASRKTYGLIPITCQERRC